VPYSNYGIPTVIRSPSPGLQSFILQVARNDGADLSLATQYSADPTRNGEPFGELGMVLQQDAAWGSNNGNPRDPQAGNLQNKVDTTDNGKPIQQVAAAEAPYSTAVVTITQEELDSIVVAARQLWTAALGAGDPRLVALDQVTVLAGNLPDGMLGETSGAQIVIDRSAQGWGWFVDPTPRDNQEFTINLGDGVFVTSAASAASGRMDLLSTVLHELGNAMGFAEDTGQDVTGMTLQPGERRVPISTDPAVYGETSKSVSQPISALLLEGTTIAKFAASTAALTSLIPTSDIILGAPTVFRPTPGALVSDIVLSAPVAFQPSPASARNGDLDGSFVSLTANLTGGSSASTGAAVARLTLQMVTVTDLDSRLIREVFGTAAVIDRDAAGDGWFVDPTPGDSSEFAVRSPARSHGLAASRAMDLGSDHDAGAAIPAMQEALQAEPVVELATMPILNGAEQAIAASCREIAPGGDVDWLVWLERMARYWPK